MRGGRLRAHQARRFVALTRAALFAVTLLAACFTTTRAHAWYFPEHAVLTGDGHAALAPELRAIIGEAVAEARKEGLPICERTDLGLEDALTEAPLVTARIRTPASVSCVPYATLPGLAGDHADDIAELRDVLTKPTAIELVSAAAYEWHRFREQTRRGQSSLDRMSFVHDLDVAFYFLDPLYVPRARATQSHFRDVGRSFETVLRELGSDGRADDVLSRFVLHHNRSLSLAAASRRVEALLEHAFAVHFLEDAFASGHLVMSEATWARGRDFVRSRHDAFNADGLPVIREMSREPCKSLATGTLELAGLPPCWTTTGDGYLGLNPDSSDRLHAAAALSRAELAFATALDPDRVLAFATNLGELALVALASKLDPAPWWTVDSDVRRKLPAGPKHALYLVRSAAESVAKLRTLPVPPSVSLALVRRPFAVDSAIIAGILAQPSLEDADDKPGEQPTPAPASSAGLLLIRPTLAQLPMSQVDTLPMRPESHLDHGWAVQLFASTGATMLVPPSAPVDFIGPAIGASAGFSYRSGTYVPGRRARSIAELSLGISQSLHVDTRGEAGGRPYLTLLDQELRWPVVWEALTTYSLPLDLAAIHRAGRVLFFNGVRVHEVVQGGKLSFLGAELEACAIALGHGYGSHPLYAVSPELRFFVGLANPSAAQPTYPSTLGPTFGITLTGGYATFL